MEEEDDTNLFADSHLNKSKKGQKEQLDFADIFN